MSTGEEKQAESAAPSQAQQKGSLLSDVIQVTRPQERDRMNVLVKSLVDEAVKGTISFDKNVTRSIKHGMAAIDKVISDQLAAIMHTPEFQRLEGSWRGLHYLVMNSETCDTLKLRVLNCSRKELLKDVENAVEFDQSEIFKKVYSAEFDMPGGHPYGALIGDFEFTNHPDDIALLGKMSQVAAAGFTPFISAADPGLFGFDSWTELAKPRDLGADFFDQRLHQVEVIS